MTEEEKTEKKIQAWKIMEIMYYKVFPILLIVGITVFIAKQILVPPSFKMTYCECRKIERETYNQYTDEVRSLIAEKNPNTSLSELLISDCGVCYEGGDGCEWCNLCQENISIFLNQAYSAVQNGDYNDSRLILLQANIYLMLHPGCFNCACVFPSHHDLPGT